MEELEKVKFQLPYYNVFAGALVALTAILALAVLYPILMVDNLDKASKLSEILKNNIVVLGGGITGVVGLALAYMRVTAATRQANAALDQAKAATEQAKAAADQALTASENYASVATRERETRLTTLLTTAVEQLGNANPSVRMGAVLALERISKESPEYFEYAFGILTSHFRHVRPWPVPDPALPIFVQALGVEIELILDVVKRSKIPDGVETLINLTGCNFAGIAIRGDWHGVNFSNSNFRNTSPLGRFYNCEFKEANIEGASFSVCHFEKCNFFMAKCMGTSFQVSALVECRFFGSYLEGANFGDARIRGGSFTDASGLTQAQISAAKEVEDVLLPDGLITPKK